MNIIRFFKNFFSSDIAIDLGSENTKIYVKNLGVVLREPTLIAVKHSFGNKEFIAYGEEAKKLIGRVPKNIEVISPLKKGAIVNLNATEMLIERLISSVHDSKFLKPSPTVLVAIQTSLSDVEKKAVEDAIYNAGAKEVVFIRQGIATALGLGVDINSTVPSCFIDMGADTTEISIIASSGIVFSRTFEVGGKDITKGIRNYLLEEYNVDVGYENSEMLKRSLSTVNEEEINVTEKSIVKGKNKVTNKPVKIEVSQKDIYLGSYESMAKTISAIDETFQELPAETVSSLFQNGIVLIGGTSKIKGMTELIHNYSGLKVEIAKNPTEVIIEGCGTILEKETFFYNYEE